MRKGKRILHTTTVLAILLLTATPSVTAQRHNISLEGTFQAGAGRKVMLFGYSDPLSQREVLLDSITIDSNNHFNLSFYANYPRLVVLQIERYSQSFYVEPGRDYKMAMDHFDWNQDEQRNVYLDPVVLPIRFLQLPNDELNIAIARFDHLCDSVIMEHRTAFDQRYRPDRRYFDTLRHAIENVKWSNNSTFFERYRTYQLAELEVTLRIDKREKIFDQLVNNRPLPYHDEHFMHFFFTLFDHSVTTGSRYVTTAELLLALESRNAEEFLDLLGNIPLLRNERIRELVAIQSLYEMYYTPLYYPADAVSEMLIRMGQNTKFEEHRQLIQNIMYALRLTDNPTADLMQLTLPDEYHVMHSLDSLKGKWTYIAFVRIDDANSVGELQTMAHFRDTVYRTAPDSVQFLTIVCDREPQKMYHFLHNERHSQRYRWQFFHFNNNYDLLYRIGVTSFPAFILLRPDGSRVGDDAPAPASGFLLHGPWIQKKEAEAPRKIYEFNSRFE